MCIRDSAYAARRLNIRHGIRTVDSPAKIKHHRPKFFKRHGDVDVNALCAAVKAAQVIIQLKRHMVYGCLLYTSRCV